MKKNVILLFLVFAIFGNAFAAKYSVDKGSELKVNCTAQAPAGGWITHAFFTLVDSEDAEYLGIEYSSGDCAATYYGFAAKSNIKVEVTYAYSYRGSYDGNIHVGHGTYYDYVTVTGAPKAKSFTIKEGDYFKVRPGQKIELHCDFYPKGSEANVEWGIITAISTYNCVDLEVMDKGASCVVTAKKRGTAYLLAMFPGDSKSAQPVTVEITNNAEVVSPESVVFDKEEISLIIGDKFTVTPKFYPENSFANLVWESENEKIATVNNGQIIATGPGETKISAWTEDRAIHGEIAVKVKEPVTDFSVPAKVEVALGYNFKVEADFTPKGSVDTIIWASDDKDVATVSAAGEIKAKRIGSTKIKVTSKTLSVTKEIEVNVVALAKGLDADNVRVRVNNFKGVVNRTIVNR